ncbi:MAG TPA: DUF2807 domain-containing protein [Bacteroidales bacterium]|nr:DUF2807 domain-containing protein [Bacteroidales bacterium]
MKKLFIITILSLLSTIALAQKETLEKRNFQVDSFTGIAVSGVVEVTLEKSASHSVSLETYNEVFEYIEVKVRNGILHIGFKDGGVPRSIQRKYKDLKVTSKVTLPVLESVELSGVTKLFARDRFDSHDLNIELSGVSQAEFEYIESAAMDVEVSGVSKIQLYGETEQLDLEISGASKGFFVMENKSLTFANIEISGSSEGTFEGKAIRSLLDISGTAVFEGMKFQVETMKAVISGVARARVNVAGSLEPEVSGAAKLRYNGNVTLRNVNKSGAAHMTTY